MKVARRWVAFAAGVAACGLPIFASAQSLSTGDGFSLSFSTTGQVTGAAIGAQRFTMTPPGGFFAADYRNQPALANLYTTPGFEGGWSGWDRRSDTKYQALDSSEFHSGAASARIFIPGSETASSSLGRIVEVKPNTPYQASFWTKRRNCTSNASAFISEIDAAGNYIGTQLGMISGALPENQWTLVTKSLWTSPATTKLLVRADIWRSSGTVWVDEFELAEITKEYLPLTGTFTSASANELRLAAQRADRQLSLTAVFKADADKISIDGALRSLSTAERAVALTFRLPLDAVGWKWFDDIAEARTIAAGWVYRNVTPIFAGDGFVSTYPFAALANDRVSLAWGIPLSQGPRVYVLGYDAGAKHLFCTFYFALSQQQKTPGEAQFSLVVYRNAKPEWGLRSAAARYYAAYPESFKKRPWYEGYLNYARLEKFEAAGHRLNIAHGRKLLDDPSDFGEGYQFLDAIHGCYHYLNYPTEDRSMPSDAAVYQFLDRLIEQEQTKPSSYVATTELLKKLAFGAAGQILYIGDTRYWGPREGYNHTDQPGWGLNFYVNEDPEVSNTLRERARTVLENYATQTNRQPFSATLTADAIEGYGGVGGKLDYRPEHLARSDVPLTFASGTLKPAIANGIYDFHKSAWWPLSEQYQVVIYGNANHYNQAFTLPFVDVPMTECVWDTQHPARLDRYLRTLAHHKIWRYWWNGQCHTSSDADIRAFFARGLTYAIYPALYTMEDPEAYRALYRRYVPAIEQINAAGWEPVPYARADDPDAALERYGALSSDNLFLTLGNYSAAAKAIKVNLDAAGLGAASASVLRAYDLLDGNPVQINARDLSYTVAVEAGGARAVALYTTAGLSRYALREVDKGLGRLERFFGTELTSADINAVQQIRGKVAAGLQGGDALARYEEILAALNTLQANITTTARVDLAKIFFRMRSIMGAASAALAGAEVETAGLVEAFAGTGNAVKIKVTNYGGTPLRGLAPVVVSPWPELVSAPAVGAAMPTELAAGASLTIDVTLHVPRTTERTLLPYLVGFRGTLGEQAFEAVRTVDVQLSKDIAPYPPGSLAVR